MVTHLNLDFSSKNGEMTQQVTRHRLGAQQMVVSQHTEYSQGKPKMMLLEAPGNESEADCF